MSLQSRPLQQAKLVFTRNPPLAPVQAGCCRDCTSEFDMVKYGRHNASTAKDTSDTLNHSPQPVPRGPIAAGGRSPLLPPQWRRRPGVARYGEQAFQARQ